VSIVAEDAELIIPIVRNPDLPVEIVNELIMNVGINNEYFAM
jgi:hypothetical protein